MKTEVKQESRRCQECGLEPPVHKIDCVTGNERARVYQEGLKRKYRRSVTPVERGFSDN